MQHQCLGTQRDEGENGMKAVDGARYVYFSVTEGGATHGVAIIVVER